MYIGLLDCTLRDGGYINNWDFNLQEYNRTIQGLSDAGVDYIEVGIMGNDSSKAFNTKFAHYDEIPPLPEQRNTKFTVMSTVGEAENIPVPYHTNQSVDAVRVAFFKPDVERMLRLVENIKCKGYNVFLQAMATYMYNDMELESLLRHISNIKADAFYLVDSFGTLYPNDVKNMVKVVNNSLDYSIPVGFHAHNNIQLALANDVAFLEEMSNSGREAVFVDATIYGMGRGAGNTPIELLVDYLNNTYGKKYKNDIIRELYFSIIQRKHKDNYWGYEYLYYLSSRYKVNMAYIWYFRELKDIKDERIVGEMLSKIPEERRYTLDKDIANNLIKEFGFGDK